MPDRHRIVNRRKASQGKAAMDSSLQMSVARTAYQAIAEKSLSRCVNVAGRADGKTSDKTRIGEKRDGMAGLHACRFLSKFDKTIRLHQGRQEARALARELDGFI